MMRLRFMLLAVGLCLLAACEHRELVDPNTSHYIRVYLDEDIRNVTYGFYDSKLEHPEYSRPKVMRVIMTDPHSDALVAERYLQNQGDDERGHYFEGYISAPAGEYNLLTYSFGSAVTQVRNEDSFYDIEAYTMPLGNHYMQYIPSSRVDMAGSPMVYAPEHIFHDAAERIVIENSTMVDTLLNASGDYFCAHSMVKSYHLQVKVSGFEWINTAVSLLSGMAGSSKMHGHNMIEGADDVNIFFSMNYTDRQYVRSTSTATLYATFNTFGKLPDVESIYTLNFEFTRSDGSSQVEKIDITSLFDTPQARDNQWLIIDKEIVVSPPESSEGGGMTPGVDVWKNVESNLQL
jgi:hypothetical protein